MLQELEKDNLSELLNDNEMVIVQYSAGWCGNCRIMKPKFKRLSENFDKVRFVLADAEQFPASRQLAKVDNLPTFAAFKKGTLIKQIQTNKAEALNNFVDEVTNH